MITQLQFQQSFVEYVEVPQTQFVQTVHSGGAAGAVPAVLDAFGGSKGFLACFRIFSRSSGSSWS